MTTQLYHWEYCLHLLLQSRKIKKSTFRKHAVFLYNSHKFQDCEAVTEAE